MHPKEPNPDIQRVRFSLRAAGNNSQAPDRLRSGVHSRGYLPHVKREGVSYFVTFRLADSLPREVLLKFQAERAARLRTFFAASEARKKDTATPMPSESEDEINRDYNRDVERYLDRGAGACYLRRPEIAELVANAMRYFEGQRYYLSEWVVMPNHVHAVLRPMANHSIGEIMKSWKGYTAREANKTLNRIGEPFWQQEPFDHWIRDDEERARICRYVRNNPVTARLCAAPEDWRWSSAWPDWKTAKPAEAQ